MKLILATLTISAGLLTAVSAFAVPKACTFNGKSIASGSTVNAYLAASVLYGQTCTSQVRSCFNGTLSGTYANASCTVQPPVACSFNGQTVASGSTVYAYNFSTVPYQTYCSPMARTCTNGVLSGSAPYSSCTVQPPASCTFGGQTYASGATVPGFYYYDGMTCTAGVSSCYNGMLTQPLLSTCFTPIMTVSPASQYQCTNRTNNYPTTGQFYDVSFGLQPATDADCIDANNFYIARGGGGGYGVPSMALWNKAQDIKEYNGYIAPAVGNSKCQVRHNADPTVWSAPLKLSTTDCETYCKNDSLTNPSVSVTCYFAATPIEGFSNGTGNNPAVNWMPPPAPVCDASNNWCTPMGGGGYEGTGYESGGGG